MTRDDARKLARGIERYWAQRGGVVECHVIECALEGRNPYWVVRSDMRNGLPTKRTPALAPKLSKTLTAR